MNNTPITACPFCASSAVHVIQLDDEAWTVSCPHCECLGPIVKNPTLAVERWNRRYIVVEGQIRAAVAEEA